MRNLICDPCDGFPCDEPTEDDWAEFADYCDALDREAMDREFAEANMELLTVGGEDTPQ